MCLLVSGTCCGLSAKAKFPSLRDFKGLQTAFFDDESGRRYLRVGYREATAEKPKVGFLRLGLAFLKIHDLHIDLDARWARKETLLDLFQKVSAKRGVRYAVAEPIELVIRPQTGDAFRITATKGKFTSAGALRVWGDVQIARGETISRRGNISLTADPLSNSLLLSMDDGKETISIPLKSESTAKTVLSKSKKP
ncbi:MAG: hypothetical protein O3B25_13555 [Verrucomicrobia bacterium]|nr:hypothetical protein [Verrucomicrobiota bacterium]